MTAEVRAWCEEQTLRLLPLITKLARCVRLPLPLEDLVQEGAMACFQALPRFDAARGLKLETFITWRVRGAMIDYARQMGRFTQGGARTGRSTWSESDWTFSSRDHKKRLGDILADADAIEPSEASQRDRWAGLLKGFCRSDRLIVLLYFVEGRTMKQIGQSLGLSESRISQRTTRLLARLREADQRDGRVREACA